MILIDESSEECQVKKVHQEGVDVELSQML